MSGDVLLVPASVWRTIHALGWPWGMFNTRVTGDVVTISHIWNRGETAHPVTDAWLGRHFTKYSDVHARVGVWYRTDPGLHAIHAALTRRVGAVIPTDFFQQFVPQGWIAPGPQPIPVVAYSLVNGDEPMVSVWHVSDQQAVTGTFSVVDDDRSPLDFVASDWPVDSLAGKRVAIAGVGSIGCEVADALARAGVGELRLIDYDRLEQRNLARHRLGAQDLGRLKVEAMRDRLARSYPNVDAQAFAYDVLVDTDYVRPLLVECDAIVCAVDGVAARRVVNHLARRANRPLVLATVLEDGAFGEIVRVHPRTGCLLCLRATQEEQGSVNPEPAIDLGYGTGTAHRPMTASPSDLALLGSLAGKVTLSTLLAAERWNQRLPGDLLVVALQPVPDMPPPFDLGGSGDSRWHPLPPTRADCPTCSGP